LFVCGLGTYFAHFLGRCFVPSGHALPPLECKCPELENLNPHLFEGSILQDKKKRKPPC